SPATVVCAIAGTVVSRPSARTASRVRIMTVAPESERLSAWLPVPGLAGAPRRKRALADVAELCRSGDHVAFDFPLHPDLEHLAVFGRRPHDGHLAVGDPAGDLVFAVLVGDVAGEPGPRLVDRHVHADLAERRHELDTPETGDVRLLCEEQCGHDERREQK